MNEDTGNGCEFLVTVTEVARHLEHRGMGLKSLAEEDPKWFFEKICKTLLGKVRDQARDDGCKGRVTVVLEIPDGSEEGSRAA